jgi:hypothetical protein
LTATHHKGLRLHSQLITVLLELVDNIQAGVRSLLKLPHHLLNPLSLLNQLLPLMINLLSLLVIGWVRGLVVDQLLLLWLFLHLFPMLLSLLLKIGMLLSWLVWLESLYKGRCDRLSLNRLLFELLSTDLLIDISASLILGVVEKIHSLRVGHLLSVMTRH